MKNKQTFIALGVVALIAVAILGLEQAKPEQGSSKESVSVSLSDSERAKEKSQKYDEAREISTPDGFINYPETGLSENQPFTLASEIGKKVILIEFWTYSCINCQRVIPYLNAWDAKYRDDGLLIVGIHTPEFEFEKDFENVKRAVEKYDVTWPVVLDNDYSTWRAYKNQYWPRKYLIDIDGYIVYDHIGEGAYDETEAKIVELLNERKVVLGEEGNVAVKEGNISGIQEVDFSKVGTPETYLGSSRIQYIRNLPRTTCLGGSCDYYFSDNSDLIGYELSGTWRIDPEEAVLESDTGALRIAFTASKVNLVAGQSEKPVRAKILLDGNEIGEVTFTEHDLYNLVDLKGEYGSHILEIQFLDSGVNAFAFTFG